MDAQQFSSQPDDIKKSYLILMSAVASADRSNTEAELAFVEQMSKIAGLSEESANEVKESMKTAPDLGSHLAKFRDNNLKFALVSDLLNLASVDGLLNVEETNTIKQISQSINISAEQYDAIVQYVQTANAEATKISGTPKPDNKSFLEQIGLKSVFQKLGIPVEHFLAGTTITAALGGVAYMLLQNYTKPNAQGSQANTLGGMLGGFLGNSIKGEDGKADGLMGVMAGFFTSEAGAATINNVLTSVAQATAEGKGIGNIAEVIGNKVTAGNPLLQGLLTSILQQPTQK